MSHMHFSWQNKDGSLWNQIRVEKGQVSYYQGDKPYVMPMSVPDSRGFDINTYDRMSVLAAEIRRLVSGGRKLVFSDFYGEMHQDQLKTWFCHGVPLGYD